MIRVRATITDDRMCIDVFGHAAFEEPGRDIVCAGVSMLMQTTLLGLEAAAQHYSTWISAEVNDQRTRRAPTPPSPPREGPGLAGGEGGADHVQDDSQVQPIERGPQPATT